MPKLKIVFGRRRIPVLSLKWPPCARRGCSSPGLRFPSQPKRPGGRNQLLRLRFLRLRSGQAGQALRLRSGQAFHGRRLKKAGRRPARRRHRQEHRLPSREAAPLRPCKEYRFSRTTRRVFLAPHGRRSSRNLPRHRNRQPREVRRRFGRKTGSGLSKL